MNKLELAGEFGVILSRQSAFGKLPEATYQTPMTGDQFTLTGAENDEAPTK